MQSITRLTLALSTVVALASPALVDAQAMTSAEPFKVGTFEIDGAPTVGVVLRDALIIDLAAANTALEIDPMYAHVNAPADMLELIGQYDYGLKYRIYEIVNNVVGNDQLGSKLRTPCRGRGHPSSHHVSQQDHERRGQLLQSRV